MTWIRRLEKLVAGADDLTDRMRARVRRILPPRGPLLIQPYAGYGTPKRVLLHGRVLKDEGFADQQPGDSVWRNLLELYKRLESDEVPGACVRARIAGVEQTITADTEGYFAVDLMPPRPLERSGWHDVELELLDPTPPDGPVRAAGPVLVPPASARFGVISDIDDTVVWTNVTNKLRMLALLVRTNPHTRKPFKGVAAFYRALRDGAGGAEGNPVFYVSGSPWNLYPPLVAFLRVQGIPEGPLLLRDFGDHILFSSREEHTHKRGHIERILLHFPELDFILIGDSGEKDPEIYTEIVKAFPDRIRVVYIRSVNPDPTRIEAIDRLIAEVGHTGAQLVLAPDTDFAAAHAAAEGLISPEGLSAVRADKRQEEEASPD